jgi:hypothetical protein
MAKLERKRRHYGVTGFVVASAIARAFKLVEGTSNAPKTPSWFAAVVENALRAKHHPEPEQRGQCRRDTDYETAEMDVRGPRGSH